MATILVADDEEKERDPVVKYLKSLGHKVVPATCVDEACKILARRHIDAVVSDYSMEDATGVELAMFIDEQCKQKPKVILHTSATEETVKKWKNPEYDDLRARGVIHAFVDKGDYARIGLEVYELTKDLPMSPLVMEDKAHAGPAGDPRLEILGDKLFRGIH